MTIITHWKIISPIVFQKLQKLKIIFFQMKIQSLLNVLIIVKNVIIKLIVLNVKIIMFFLQKKLVKSVMIGLFGILKVILLIVLILKVVLIHYLILIKIL